MTTNGLVKHMDAQPKPYKRNGVTHWPQHTDGIFNARIENIEGRRVITIDGVYTNVIPGSPFKPFEKTFTVGDQAEYDSFNLKYVGTITAIGPNSVTIQHYPGQKEVTRLDVFEFIRRNWDFDATKHETHNRAELECL